MDGVERILNNSWLPAVVTSVEESREWGTVWGFFSEKEGLNTTQKRGSREKSVFAGG
jgi:hypothetical protein